MRDTESQPVESLREEISKTMGWWSPDGFDAYPEKTDKVMQLLARETKAADMRARIDEWNLIDETLYSATQAAQLHLFDVREKRLAKLHSSQPVAEEADQLTTRSDTAEEGEK